MRVVSEAVVAPSRTVEGVLNFDIAQDNPDPNLLISTEVFAERAALVCQESLPDVQKVISRQKPRRLFTTPPPANVGLTLNKAVQRTVLALCVRPAA